VIKIVAIMLINHVKRKKEINLIVYLKL